MPQLIYFSVYAGVLFDIHILAGDVGLGLIIIVIGDKIFHGVFGEEFPEFTAKLCRQRLVMSKNEGRTVKIRYDICHSKGFTRACYAEQRLALHTRFHACRQHFYCLGLVACGLIF